MMQVVLEKYERRTILGATKVVKECISGFTFLYTWIIFLYSIFSTSSLQSKNSQLVSGITKTFFQIFNCTTRQNINKVQSTQSIILDPRSFCLFWFFCLLSKEILHWDQGYYKVSVVLILKIRTFMFNNIILIRETLIQERRSRFFTDKNIFISL